jgi:hypothetical protein
VTIDANHIPNTRVMVPPVTLGVPQPKAEISALVGARLWENQC